MDKHRKEETDADKEEVKKDDTETDRLARGGQGGDNTSEMLAKWRDERREGLE